MPLETIDIPFTGGIDQEIAEKILPADGRLSDLKEAEIDEIGKLRSRRGLDTNMVSSVAETRGFVRPFAHGKKLLRALPDRIQIYEQSGSYPRIGTVSDRFGGMRLITEEVAGVSTPENSIDDRYVDAAIQGNYYVVTAGSYFYVLDKEDYRVVQGPTSISGGSTISPWAAVIPLEATRYVAILYSLETSTDLRMRVLDMNSPSGTGSDGVLVTGDIIAAGPKHIQAVRLHSNYIDQFAVAYKDTANDLKIRVFDRTGTEYTGSPATVAGTVQSIGLGAVDLGTGVERIYCGWGHDTGAVYQIRRIILQLNPVNLSTAHADALVKDHGAVAGLGAITLVEKATSNMLMYWNYFDSVGTPSIEIARPLWNSLINYDGTIGTPAEICGTLTILSQPISLYNNINDDMNDVFFLGKTEQVANECYFVARHSSGAGELDIVGRFYIGRGHDQDLTRPLPLLPEAGASPGSFKFFVPRKDISPGAGTDYSALAYTGKRYISRWHAGNYDIWGLSAGEADIEKLGNVVQVHNTSIIAGGQLWDFDGVQVVEHGFHYFPGISTTVAGAGSGQLLSNGDYKFRATYEWYDALGRRYESAPSEIAEATGVTAGQKVDVPVTPLELTHKTNVYVNLYRTVAGGDTFYLEQRAANAPGASMTFVGGDVTLGLSDTDLINQRVLYTSNNEIDHIAPPACHSIAEHENRLVICDHEGKVRYSKTHIEDRGVQFNDAAWKILPSAYGRPHTLASMAGQLCVFADSGIFRLYGDGPSNIGLGDFVGPVEMNSAIGALEETHALTWSGGIAFVGSDSIPWNIDRGFAIRRIGGKIQRSIDGASFGRFVEHPTKPYLCLATTAGTFVWHKETGNWVNYITPGSWTLDSADLCVWNKYLVVATVEYSGGTVQYSMRAQDSGSREGDLEILTGWIRPGRLNGFMRLKWIYVLGEYSGAGGNETITIELQYEDGTSESFSKLWTASDEPYVVRMKPAKQKASAFRVKISYGFEGAPDAILYGISLMVQLKSKYPLKGAKTL